MKRLSFLVVFFFSSLFIFLDTMSWSSTRFACGADIFNESGDKLGSKNVIIKVDLPLPVVFWRKSGLAQFDISNNTYTSLASQVDENYRIIFSNMSHNSFDGYIYLLTQKAELRQGKTKLYLDCDMIDHSSSLFPDPFSITII